MSNFFFSGTLGDAFIVYCKAYNYCSQTGEKITLRRLSKHQAFDHVIKELFNLMPLINYAIPSIHIESGKEIETVLKEEIKQYVNSLCSEKSDHTGRQDPFGFSMHPFPQTNLSMIDLDSSKRHVGVQLHSGSVGHNFRGFSLKWLSKFRAALEPQKYEIYIFGSGKGYDENKITQFCVKNNISNYLGKTSFTEWLQYIKSMNSFVSFEGFSAFFAMSQRVPTVMFDQYTFGVDGSIHPEWKEKNLIIKLSSNYILKKIRYRIAKYLRRNNLYAPANIETVIQFINNSLNERIKDGRRQVN